MDDVFKIYVEQLRNGHAEKINEELPPDFLDIQEKELLFPSPVKVKGEAYLANQDLVLCFDVTCPVQLPCSVCNQAFQHDIVLKRHYVYVPVSEIKGGIYHFGPALREAILLEIPQFLECNQGSCPERKIISKYLKDPSSSEEEEGHRPFADLN